jgi:hypothetical protein
VRFLTYKDALDCLDGIVRKRGHPITPHQVVDFINESFYKAQKFELENRGIIAPIEALRKVAEKPTINIPQAEKESQKIIQELREARQLKATIFVRHGVKYSQGRDAKGRFTGKNEQSVLT